jgi:hypothetical protein
MLKIQIFKNNPETDERFNKSGRTGDASLVET